MSLDERLLVPEAKSLRSTSATRRPPRAASRAIPAPVMPPPMTSRSKVWAAACSSMACRSTAGPSRLACVDTAGCAAMLADALARVATFYVAAIDQGTTSTRCMVFDHAGGVVAIDQKTHEQIYPRPGWVEHDPVEIWRRTQEVVVGALSKAGLTGTPLVAIGITNQRETAVVWDRRTGAPLYNAIVWQDTRTDQIITELGREGGQDRFRTKTGLPLATYFSGPKVKWILDNVHGAPAAAEAGNALFGNIDTFVTWWLTGGPDGGVHVTDVTNASRTLMMDLRTLDWDAESLEVLGIPRRMLPNIRSSSEVYGKAGGSLAGVPVAGILGDQQAATVGQTCYSPGEAKNTYGTGCFMLLNTGTEPIASTSGLLTTLCYEMGSQPAVYALEGAIAITGALVQWLRDNLGLIQN